MKTFSLWKDKSEQNTLIHWYSPEEKKNNLCLVIFAGGAYRLRSDYEGDAYAKFLSKKGYNAFVVDYHVQPQDYSITLLDARRAIRFIRANAEKFGIDKNKVIVMGSSAGGHLVALVSTFQSEIIGEGIDLVDMEEYLPDGQILCYPVISSNEEISHKESYQNLLTGKYFEKEKYSPELLVHKNTPQAFIWHTSTDCGVNVINSYKYAEALRKNNIPCEMHVFPCGGHGLGLAENNLYVTRWKEWLIDWLELSFSQ